MNRRLILLFALWVASFAPLMAQKFKTSSLPNVIYIYLDDMGYGELGSYGQQKIKTPNLDKMAAEGMRFTRHYSSAPVCAPARARQLSRVRASLLVCVGVGGLVDTSKQSAHVSMCVRVCVGLCARALAWTCDINRYACCLWHGRFSRGKPPPRCVESPPAAP